MIAPASRTRVTMRIVLLVCFVLIPSICCSSDEYIDYFKSAQLDVDQVIAGRSAALGSGHEIRTAYGYRLGRGLEGHFVGVFLVRNGALVEVVDVIPSERSLDFLPVIGEAGKSHAVISFVSDYGELAKRKYVFELHKAKKLVELIRLPAQGIPDDLH